MNKLNTEIEEVIFKSFPRPNKYFPGLRKKYYNFTQTLKIREILKSFIRPILSCYHHQKQKQEITHQCPL